MTVLLLPDYFLNLNHPLVASATTTDAITRAECARFDPWQTTSRRTAPSRPSRALP